jgi:solute carrier family 25 phosphate transporter 23/24/25/41
MTLIGYIPFNALNFMFYEYYKEKVDSKCPSFLIGGMAGFSSVSFTYPTDLIRRRLQLQGFHESVPKYKGILDCFQKIIRQDGVRGLYRGLGACYLKIFPTIGIQFLVIEHLKRHMI